MNTPKDLRPDQVPLSGNTRPKKIRNIARIVALSFGGVLLLAVILLAALTLWLTPSRLTELVNREGSEWLDADVKASDVRFTIWSSFPHFCLEADSLSVNSRTLRGLSRAQRDSLPADAERLLNTGRIHGSVNLLRLLTGTISLRNVEVEHLDLNLVDFNDSVNNYSILPPDSRGSFHVPRFTANSVRLSHTRPLRYFSASTGSVLNAPIDSARLERTRSDCYRVIFGGRVSLSSGNMKVLRDFPFMLSGEMTTAFHPFRVGLSDFSVALADTKGKVNLDLVLGEDATVRRFSYNIDRLNPLSMLTYLPGASIPFLKEIKADVDMNLSARLTSPYCFSASALPSLAIDFRTLGGSLEYDFGGARPLTVDNIFLDGTFNFNGAAPDKSSVNVRRLEMQGEGTRLSATADIRNLTTVPVLSSEVTASAELSRLSEFIPGLGNYRLDGILDADMQIGFSLPESPDTLLADIRGNGSILLCRPSLSGNGLTATADTLAISFDAEASAASPQGICVTALATTLEGERATVVSGHERMKLGKLRLEAGEPSSPVLWKESLPSGVPFGFSLALSDMTAHSSGSASVLTMKSLSSSGKVSLDASSGLPVLDAALKIPSVKMTGPSTKIRIDGTSIQASVRPRDARKNQQPSEVCPPSPDKEALARLRHTKEYVSVSLPDNMKSLLDKLSVTLDLRMAGGELHTPSFPARIVFSNLDLKVTDDAVSLSSLKMRSQKSAATVSGSLSGLHAFLTSGLLTPLSAVLSLRLDTVSINQLAHTYARGLELTKGSAASLSAPKPATLSATDSTALLIPRNLNIHADATAKETIYTNLHLYDLSTSIDVAGGDARINDLRISSDFGHAGLGLTYTTSDIMDMNLKLNAALEDIDLVRFFQRFHTLLLMMPQMKNLSGYISLAGNMNMNIYPTMYANVGSLSADLNAQGRDLLVHQDHFIRKITRMMLIPTDGDLHIDNMNVRASVHDNLLELYPFTFAFDRYRISMQGINNFNGRLYYHVGVLESPLHVPFGINITGMFSHPGLHFGGAHYKVEKGAEVARYVEEANTFNIIRELKYYLNMFVKKAAEADDTP